MSGDALTQRRRGAERGSWPRMRLGDVCEINMGQSPESSTYNTSAEGLPFYQGNADFGTIHPTPRVWCNAPVKIAKAGDLLVSVRAPIGALNFANEMCCIGRGLAALSALPNAEYGFLYYALKSKVAELNAKGTGSTFKAINKRALSQLSIPLPPLVEQRRIASKLNRLCHIVTERRAQLVQLQQLVKSRFVEMFGDGKYPEKFLADVSTKITDGTHKTPKYLSTGVRFISAKNIIDGHIDLTNTKFISEDEYQEIQRRCNLELGDVLLTKSGSLGAVAIVDRQERLGLFESLAVIKAKRELIDVCYLKYAIDSPAVQHQFKQGVKGIAIRHLHLNVIARTRIPLPPLALQREFATFVAKVDKLAFAVRKSLESAEKLYRQQLSEAFA